MASSVDICNLALANISQKANVSSISPPEASAESQHCARFYPIALSGLLEMHAWGFATKRANLALLTLPATVFSWLYAYAYPSDCVKPLKVMLPESTDDTATQDFDVETFDDGTRVIYTNVEDATLVYTRSVTDTGKFTPLFVLALSWLLASMLAGPITKDDKKVAATMKTALWWFGQASASDANARKNNAYGSVTKHVPGAMAARL